MAQEISLLFDLGLVLVAGTIFGLIAKELKQPLLIGYVVAGIIIGPSVLKLISDLDIISVLSQLGVAFLLFAIGMEINFSKLSKLKKVLILGGIAQVGITVAVVMLFGGILGLSTIESVYLGLIVAFSSSVVAVKILTDTKQVDSLEGKLIIGFALVQDMLAVFMLPFIQNPETIFSVSHVFTLLSGFAMLLVSAYLLSKVVFPRFADRAVKSQEIFYLTVISSCFVFIFLSDFFNFPFAVGAFIGGVVLGRIRYSHEAKHSVEYLADMFGSVFFVSLGLGLNMHPEILSSPIFIMLILVVFILNPIILTSIGLIAGYGLRTSLTVGLALFQASEFSFILAQQGLELGHLTQEIFDMVVLLVLLSMMATPYMVELNGSIHSTVAKHFGRFKERFRFFERKVKRIQTIEHEELLDNHIITREIKVKN